MEEVYREPAEAVFWYYFFLDIEIEKICMCVLWRSSNFRANSKGVFRTYRRGTGAELCMKPDHS